MLLTRSVVRKVWKSTFSVLLVCLLMIQKCAAGFSNYTGDPCLSDSDCSEYRQICNTDIGFCQCNEFSTPYEYAPGKQLCMLCPGEGQPCEDNCCYGEDIFCIHDVCTQCKRKENGGFLCPNGGHLIFATASQIALSAALIIGIAALATLLFRMCSKRSLADRPRNRGLLSEDDARFSSERASLSSIQIRILQRLRDRPPRYETRHNYNFRSQSQDAGIAPPSYDSTAAPSTDTELPPSYTIAIGAPAFDNSGFTGEGEAERSRSADAPDRRDRNSETSKSPILVDDDKAIHM
ncbi:uncharacterized protein LOC132258327 [Phlebotomus argentipes]|uniref:uncharacterized protein LOC132258327 n=1 Tax=Phlebotomus argentipes TaxID=94469 RepID=UPI0028931945|nr:uncharacterized protein LOC132258327 [Phlebotomus argentipes]